MRLIILIIMNLFIELISMIFVDYLVSITVFRELELLKLKCAVQFFDLKKKLSCLVFAASQCVFCSAMM